ncbi:MAG: ABC transporter permease [Bacteroidales bacterium]|nr:ABC transporter permease [Bacteroidales bacterium]
MRDLIEEIWSTLRQNKLRTALTGFSVAWGIFMIIVLIGAGNGLMNSIAGNFSMLKNSMEIYAGTTSKPYGGYEQGRRLEFTTQDVEALRHGYFKDRINDICPVIRHNTEMHYGKIMLRCNLKGVYEISKGIDNTEIVAGRFINSKDIKEKRKVMVIGTQTAKNLVEKGRKPEEMIGKMIDVSGLMFKIVGLYKSDESEGGAMFYTEVLAPTSTVASIFMKENEINSIQMTFEGIDTEEKNREFDAAYRRVINRNHNADPTDKNTIYVYNSVVERQSLNRAARKVRKALWILGLLTLISGIAGVSNIMLITVKERTHEFGIRKAIGARPCSVIMLIIAESITITSFFGYMGMVLGMAMNQFLDFKYSDKAVDVGIAQVTMFVNPGVGLNTAIEATLILIIAGTIAGMIPAWRAARVKPIEALRAE